MSIQAGGRRGMWLVIAAAVAALVLGIATTALIAATSGHHGPGPAPWPAPAAQCNAPALPGRVVEVTAGDRGPGMMSGGPGRHMAMMRLQASANSVPAGEVSLLVLNAGALTHEVIVLPLPAGQAAGERPVGPDGRIDETGSLAEASQTCGPGAGEGIRPGATAWTTTTLQPGRYELICNLPGHYTAGMYTELDVTSP
ncbi:sulfocyanin-like copper-binding protein [Kitasatospora sp. NPDC059648]|uniref:sulfocyanin-like copper-binding protein n=1 Tax=Kitasatospora sp. NPDC059648 TaxID=3346894 RepID=UPI003695A346